MMPFSYTAPHSVAEGIEARVSATATRTRYLAGGTDLVPLLKSGIEQADRLVSLRRLHDLPRDIACTEAGAQLGALCTLADIAGHEELRTSQRALVQAAALAASPQLRNMATLGGTLLQRPRCWYFRNPTFHCWLKGGTVCHAREGLNQAHGIFDTGVCRAVHPSDIACALVALEARIELLGPRGPRQVGIRDFLQPPEPSRRTESVVEPAEIVAAVRIPAPQPATRSVFLKEMDRAAWSFATLSVAARVTFEGTRIASLEVVLGAVATVPWAIGHALSDLIGTDYDDERTQAALRAALARADPLVMNGYKVPLACNLARRALRELAGTPK